MAKGLRASVKKNNRNKLRARVFGPVEDARTQRLSAKLLELARQPKPAKSEMEVDSEKGNTVSHYDLTPAYLHPLTMSQNSPTNSSHPRRKHSSKSKVGLSRIHSPTQSLPALALVTARTTQQVTRRIPKTCPQRKTATPRSTNSSVYAPRSLGLTRLAV